MLKNDDHKVLNKLIMATFLALLGSLLSALYITTAHAEDKSSNEIQINATHAGKVSNFESPNKIRAKQPARHIEMITRTYLSLANTAIKNTRQDLIF